MRIAAILICVVSFASWSLPASAAVKVRFVVDGLANCPPLRNYPLHVEGDGTLSGKNSATLAVRGNVENTEYSAKLGGRPTAAPDGSAALQVTSQSSLRATRDYPNNVLVIDIKVVGNNCSIRINHRLKPGKKDYTFTTSLGLAHCERPTTTSATCSAQ